MKNKVPQPPKVLRDFSLYTRLETDMELRAGLGGGSPWPKLGTTLTKKPF